MLVNGINHRPNAFEYFRMRSAMNQGDVFKPPSGKAAKSRTQPYRYTDYAVSRTIVTAVTIVRPESKSQVRAQDMIELPERSPFHPVSAAHISWSKLVHQSRHHLAVSFVAQSMSVPRRSFVVKRRETKLDRDRVRRRDVVKPRRRALSTMPSTPSEQRIKSPKRQRKRNKSNHFIFAVDWQHVTTALPLIEETGKRGSTSCISIGCFCMRGGIVGSSNSLQTLRDMSRPEKEK